MDLRFWVKLIEVRSDLSLEEKEEIKANCTFVKNNIWIFEGDEEFLQARFKVLSEGAVGCLGDLSQEQLVDLSKDIFDFDHSLLA